MGSNIGRDIGYTECTFRGFLQSFYKNSRGVPRLGYECFFPNPFQFISHHSHHLTQYIWDTDSHFPVPASEKIMLRNAGRISEYAYRESKWEEAAVVWVTPILHKLLSSSPNCHSGQITPVTLSELYTVFPCRNSTRYIDLHNGLSTWEI
jgi:hypothetical protein